MTAAVFSTCFFYGRSNGTIGKFREETLDFTTIEIDLHLSRLSGFFGQQWFLVFQGAFDLL
jgi:hypothetical protein